MLLTEEQILARIGEVAKQIERDYEGKDLLLVGVLKGAIMIMADLARALGRSSEMDWMAVSSYGSGTKSSGVVRILKDLDGPIEDLDVIVVEDIVDSGLTLSYLLRNLKTRKPATLEVCSLLAKPARLENDVTCRYVGFEIPDTFVVGYGLDAAEQFRELPDIWSVDETKL